jgi:hypothetical protein
LGSSFPIPCSGGTDESAEETQQGQYRILQHTAIDVRRIKKRRRIEPTTMPTITPTVSGPSVVVVMVGEGEREEKLEEKLEEREKHWVSSTAPVKAVVFPTGQGKHCVSDVAPAMRLNVPRGQGVGTTAERPL